MLMIIKEEPLNGIAGENMLRSKNTFNRTHMQIAAQESHLVKSLTSDEERPVAHRLK